ncbi:MAG TPA: triose-phosphate isomerase, partial [Humisphaera sp.]|nr:triose-phosphate isomerase [Humisphaera sp.]
SRSLMFRRRSIAAAGAGQFGTMLLYFGRMFDEKSAQALAIQYGGSVKPKNAAALLTLHGVDGALIGGASLHANQFLAIVRAGNRAARTKGESG